MKLPLSQRTRRAAPEPAPGAVASRGDSGGVRRRRVPPAIPEPVFDQAELRVRRRGRQRVAYTSDFSLSREIDDVCSPPAARIAELPNPRGALVWVSDLAEATHEAVSVIVGWLAEVDAKRKTEHLAAEPARRRNAITRLVDLTPRPPLPEISEDDLRTGAWVAVLTALVQPYTAPLAELLARAHPPDAEALRGTPSRSQRLERLLAETVDRRALSLERFIDRAAATRRHRPADPAEAKRDQARRELAELGVQWDGTEG